jgi:polyvinyl alcohol dehydrogenase (cytochrome)
MQRLALMPALWLVAFAASGADTASIPAVSPVDDPTFQGKTAAPPHAGEPLFEQHCASCHLGQVPKAPHKMFLQMMSPDAIQASLEQGVMRPQAAGMTPEQRRLVATYLGGDHVAHKAAPRCDGKAAFFDARREPVTAGWGLSPENTRFIPADVAGLSAGDLPRLEVKWAFAFPGALRVRSQPSVAYGAIYVGSQDGTVYALDLDTGCVRWTFRARAEVRTAIVHEPPAAARSRNSVPLVYFGDLIAWVYAVDAFTGELKWSQKADDHPNATVTASPAWHDGALYVASSALEVTSAVDTKYECCTFRGSVQALDAATGAQRWKSYTIHEPPRESGRTLAGTRILGPSGAPVWNTPTIDAARGVLYVGTGENYSSPADGNSDAIHAFRLSDGRRAWQAQKTAGDAWNAACMFPNNPNCPKENGPDVDFAAASILLRRPAGDLLLAGQKSGYVFGLDPAKEGRELWATSAGRGGIQGGVHFGMATDGERLYVPITDMLDGHDGKTHARPSMAGLHALDVASGRILWSTPADNVCAGREFCEPGVSQAVTAIPGAVLAGHMDGRLRAYDAATGKVTWQFDTAREWPTVSGEKARGGSFGGGAGPLVVDGRLIAMSGYGIYFHMPGNVMLVFALPD